MPLTSTPMADHAPSLDALERLATSADIRDRAFAASALRLRLHAEDRDRVAALYGLVRETARAQHAATRARIQDRTRGARELVGQLRATPPDVRDHWVEEILDIAYPPLEEACLPPGAIDYTPSAVSEILFMIERAELAPGKTFVDLGAGLGKVVLLVALLTGAHACGLELDPASIAEARAAAKSLAIENADFVAGDIREMPLPAADVYYLFIPSSRAAEVVERLAAMPQERRLLLFSGPLDLRRFSWLRAHPAASYWLHVYERGLAANASLG